MKNEFGEKLDSNGYAESILDLYDGRCFWCERKDRPLQRHEVFHGSNRTKSKALGLWVYLCDDCHGKLHQKDAKIDSHLKEYAQKIAMFHYYWTVREFRERFGKSYVEATDE